jgi:hypothetical protein
MLEFEEEVLVSPTRGRGPERRRASIAGALVRMGVCRDESRAQTILIVFALVNVGLTMILVPYVLRGRNSVAPVSKDRLPVEEQARESQTDYSARPTPF